MLKSRFPSSFLKGTLGLCLAVLLLAPADAIWSAGKLTLPDPGKNRGPVQKFAPGQDYPVEWIEQELAWKRKHTRPLYDRKNDFWDPANGPRRIGNVDIAKAKSPHVLHLPVGSWDTTKGRPAIADALKARPHGPNDTQGGQSRVSWP